MEQRDNMICIVGPTASGKTALSVRLAQALGGIGIRRGVPEYPGDAPLGTPVIA